MPTVPDSALVRSGESAFAWRIDGSKLQKVALKLGDRDVRSGLFPVLDGLVAGDRILAHPGSSLADGQAIEFAASGAVAGAASSASAAR